MAVGPLRSADPPRLLIITASYLLSKSCSPNGQN